MTIFILFKLNEESNMNLRCVQGKLMRKCNKDCPVSVLKPVMKDFVKKHLHRHLFPSDNEHKGVI
jgi:hypothetical protein